MVQVNQGFGSPAGLVKQEVFPNGVSRSVEGRPGVVRDDRTAAEAGPAEGGEASLSVLMHRI